MFLFGSSAHLCYLGIKPTFLFYLLPLSTVLFCYFLPFLFPIHFFALHPPPEHWAHKQQSRTTFVAWAEQIGTETVTQTEAIFADKAHEEQAFRSLRGLQRLAQKYGSASLEAACRRANRFGMVGMTRISTILESQLEHQPLPDESTTTPVVEHDNVRGSQYYC